MPAGKTSTPKALKEWLRRHGTTCPVCGRRFKMFGHMVQHYVKRHSVEAGEKVAELWPWAAKWWRVAQPPA